MIIRSNFIERRKHYRFKLKDSAFALFRKPRFLKLGQPRIAKSAQIVDLSEAGLTFQYIDRDMWQTNFRELSIAKSPGEVKVDNIPFVAVSDFSISRVADSLFLRRCGVKFGELTANQKYQLHAFIQNFTISNHPVDRRAAKDRRRSGSPLNNGSNRREVSERRRKLLKTRL